VTPCRGPLWARPGAVDRLLFSFATSSVREAVPQRGALFLGKGRPAIFFFFDKLGKSLSPSFLSRSTFFTLGCLPRVGDRGRLLLTHREGPRPAYKPEDNATFEAIFTWLERNGYWGVFHC